MKTVQNFYKSSITQDWTIGTGTFYVSIKPTVTEGWLVVSPNNATLREVIYYNSTGTDGNGDYINVTARGVGATDEQTHSIGEPVRMNIDENYWADINDDISNIVAAGAPDASTTTKGLVEIATDAEATARTVIGDTGASLVLTPANASLSIPTPIVRTYLNAASPATWTKPAGLKYVVVEVQAGGGGGGSVYNSQYSSAGAGAGGYSKKLITASSLGSTETITIGAAGVGSPSSYSPNTAATSAANSSFGSILVCNGGTYSGNNSSSPGTGGSATGGDINIAGGNGGAGFNVTTYYMGTPGNGGNSFMGYGSGTRGNGSAIGYGYGGNGVINNSSAQNIAGGNGGAGIVIVTEYY